jgi:hypothetical protein
MRCHHRRAVPRQPDAPVTERLLCHGSQLLGRRSGPLKRPSFSDHTDKVVGSSAAPAKHAGQEDIVMNTRSIARVGLALVVVLLFQSGYLWAQKGKAVTTTTPLAALFRDELEDNIRSDGGGAYLTVRDPDRTYASIVQLETDGRLRIWILRNRRVMFNFDTPARPAPLTNGQLTCHDYTGDLFYADPPSFLTGVPDNDSFYLWTFGKITYNGAEWVYDPSSMFDFRTMPVDANASTLVRVQINFYTAEDAGMFGVMPNYQLWSAETSLAGGVLKVTHPSSDVWVVEPQSPVDGIPMRSLGPNEAGFKLGVPEVRRVSPGGNCDLGDWVMPFRLTLVKQ